jgi:hypothetical protein
MPWTLDKNGVTPSVPLTAAEQLRLNTFMNAVRAGKHPKEAAKDAGDTDYKEFGNTKIRQGQIRMSQGKRVTFEVNDNTQVVKIIQVGGHT